MSAHHRPQDAPHPGPLWNQFRRLLLGTVIEALVAESIEIALPTASIRFENDSAFEFPRWDNYLRFHGKFTASVIALPTAAQLTGALQRLQATWPELLSVVDFPVGDHLDLTRDNVTVALVTRDGLAWLDVGFDLEAD